MISATWGDWFISEEIEAADPHGLSIWHLGYNGFVLRTSETDVPDAIEEVSYVVEHESGTYFNGDGSRPSDGLHDIGTEFDVRSLTFGTVGRIHRPDEWGETRVAQRYSDENDVVETANALRLDRLLPCHYDAWKGVGGDPTVLHHHAASFEYQWSIEPVQVGDRVDVGRPGVVSLQSTRNGLPGSRGGTS